MDVVEFVYILIDLITIFDTADVETPLEIGNIF